VFFSCPTKFFFRPPAAADGAEEAAESRGSIDKELMRAWARRTARLLCMMKSETPKGMQRMSCAIDRDFAKNVDRCKKNNDFTQRHRIECRACATIAKRIAELCELPRATSIVSQN